METQEWVAFIGVSGTLTGVFLGWMLQRITASTTRLAEYKEFVSYTEKLVKELLLILDAGFISYEKLMMASGPPYKTKFPNYLQEEFIDLHKRARLLDAELAVYLIWLIQAIDNLDTSITWLHDEIVKREDNGCQPIGRKNIYINTAIVHAKVVKKYSCCIWYLAIKKSSLLGKIKAKFFCRHKYIRNIYKNYKKEYLYINPINHPL